MKRTIILAVFLLSTLGAGAQSTRVVREGLARPAFGSGAKVEVTEKSDAASAIEAVDRAHVSAEVTVYCVRLFSDSSQGARTNAQAVVAKFAELYPGTTAVTSYESPWFRVTAGRFMDRAGAVAMCGRVAEHFPKAFVVQEQLSLTKLIAEREIERDDPATHNEEPAETPAAISETE